MSEEGCRKTIEKFWAARKAGDEKAIGGLLATNATYEMAGAASLKGQAPSGRIPAEDAAKHFIENFPFEDVEHVMTLVEGHRAASVYRVKASYLHGPQTTSDVCDLWEFDGENKIVSLKQFVDTALIGSMIAGEL